MLKQIMSAAWGKMAPQEDYYDLGTYRRKVTTTSKDAQTWFSRGLIWSYGFNHEEAVECFRKAIQYDPKCAMAYWGLAYALGPNYNKPWALFDQEELQRTVKETHDAVEMAHKLAAEQTEENPAEKSLISALRSRYPQKEPTKDCSIWNQEYAEDMREAYRLSPPEDLDVAALFTDALMNLTPWKLWDINTGSPAPGSYVLEAKAVLDRAFAQEGGLTHPGLLHLYIHLMEMSSAPELAIPIADNLRGLVPDSGHLQHMPSHLDVLCGDYRRAILSNEAAVRADDKFLAKAGPLNFYTMYRSHDHHFRIYAAMFAGRSKVALESVKHLEDSIPEKVLRVQIPPMADWLEGVLGMRVHVYIRFGMWKECLKLPIPKDQELYCVSTALVYYARGIALAVLGKVPEARKEQFLFEESRKRLPKSRILFNNTCIDILAIASKMLKGELSYREASYEKAFRVLREAIKLDDDLPYDEPWGWMQPTRHAYGALLLEQGYVNEAAQVYVNDLGLDGKLPRPKQHPGNVWSLVGLYECWVELGKTEEARLLWPQVKEALDFADVPVRSSCACRTKVGEGGRKGLL